MRRGSVFGICLILIIGLTAGCTPHSAAIVPVSGTVTLDGQPLADATLTFQPITDKPSATGAGIGSYGKTDAAGRYSLQLIDPAEPGALIGRHTVTINTAVANEPTSDLPTLKSPERLPPRARKHEFTVPEEGADQANFTLRSR